MATVIMKPRSVQWHKSQRNTDHHRLLVMQCSSWRSFPCTAQDAKYSLFFFPCAWVRCEELENSISFVRCDLVCRKKCIQHDSCCSSKRKGFRSAPLAFPRKFMHDESGKQWNLFNQSHTKLFCTRPCFFQARHSCFNAELVTFSFWCQVDKFVGTTHVRCLKPPQDRAGRHIQVCEAVWGGEQATLSKTSVKNYSFLHATTAWRLHRRMSKRCSSVHLCSTAPSHRCILPAEGHNCPSAADQVGVKLSCQSRAPPRCLWSCRWDMKMTMASIDFFPIYCNCQYLHVFWRTGDETRYRRVWARRSVDTFDSTRLRMQMLELGSEFTSVVSSSHARLCKWTEFFGAVQARWPHLQCFIFPSLTGLPAFVAMNCRSWKGFFFLVGDWPQSVLKKRGLK